MQTKIVAVRFTPVRFLIVWFALSKKFSDDRNRVKLDQSFAGKFFKGDYINASYIQGSTNYKEYIIAQNPRANTVDDFWIMIWQERISYCVMVTDEQGEYFRYWPRVNEKCLTYGDLNITLDERLDYTVFQKYTLTVRRKDQTREVYWSTYLMMWQIFFSF